MLSPHLLHCLWTGPPITFQVACLVCLVWLLGLFVFGVVFVAFCVVLSSGCFLNGL